MGFVVEKYDSDFQKGVMDLFVAVFRRETDEAAWRWKYHELSGNRACGAVGLVDQRVVSFYGGVPRRFLVRGEPVEGVQVVDVMVDPGMRGLLTKRGAFFRTATAFIEGFMGKAFTYSYGFPSERHLALGERYGFYERVDLLFEFSKSSSAAGRSLREIRYALRPLEFEDERIDSFWDEVKRGYAFIGVRDRDYLRRRYQVHPHHRYRLWGLSERVTKRLKGLAVVRELGDALLLLESLCHPGMLSTLLARVEQRSRSLGRKEVKFWLIPGMLDRTLRGRGYQVTGKIWVPTIRGEGCLAPESIKGHLYLTMGDSDHF
jgi:hypothetical protein